MQSVLWWNNTLDTLNLPLILSFWIFILFMFYKDPHLDQIIKLLIIKIMTSAPSCLVRLKKLYNYVHKLHYAGDRKFAGNLVLANIDGELLISQKGFKHKLHIIQIWREREWLVVCEGVKYIFDSYNLVFILFLLLYIFLF